MSICLGATRVLPGMFCKFVRNSVFKLPKMKLMWELSCLPSLKTVQKYPRWYLKYINHARRDFNMEQLLSVRMSQIKGPRSDWIFASLAKIPHHLNPATHVWKHSLGGQSYFPHAEFPLATLPTFVPPWSRLKVGTRRLSQIITSQDMERGEIRS